MTKKSLLNIFLSAMGLALCGTIVVFTGFLASEPLVVVATTSASDTVIVTLNVTAGISITSPADTTMSTALGVSQNTAVGTTTWNVKTNNSLGYTLAVKATSTPAMTSGSNSILDYQSLVPNTWNATSSNAYFGFSGFGTDVSTGTWGTGSVCSTAGSPNAISTTLKYLGFTTSDKTVATRAATTTTAGIDTTVCYAVEQNGFYVPSGTYEATIIATATTL
jgi:hypothetical protein